MPSASSNLPLIKRREAYWCYFSVLVFPLPPKIFLPTPLGAQHLRIKNKNKKTTEYENHKKVRIINSQLQSRIYWFYFNYKKEYISNISLFDLLFCS